MAVLMAPVASSEDAYVALRLFKDTLKFVHIDYEIPSTDNIKADHLLLTDDPYPNRRTAGASRTWVSDPLKGGCEPLQSSTPCALDG